MRWYALRSKPNREKALWLEVDARGFQAFYPHVLIKPANPRSRKVRPYFPGYIFVRAKLAEVGQNAFSWLPYSLGLVSFDGVPAEVPEALIQAIHKRVQRVPAAGAAQLADLHSGDPVRIESGPFAGYKALFDARVAGDERVRVFLRLLQVQQIKLELPAGQVQPATLH